MRLSRVYFPYEFTPLGQGMKVKNKQPLAVKTDVPNFRKTALATVIGLTVGSTLPQNVDAGGFQVDSYVAHIEGGYMFSESNETPYAEIVGTGQTFKIKPDDGPYTKLGLTLNLTNGWDVGLTYSGLRSGTKSKHIGPYPNATLYNVLATATTYYNFVDAEAETDHDVIDFEAGHDVTLGETTVRLFGGLRYASLNTEVRTNLRYPATGAATYQAYERRDVEFDGVGPRLGLSTSIPVSGTALSITGSFAGSAIYGSRRSITAQNQTLGGTIIGNVRTEDKEHRFIYSFDADLGLAYDIGTPSGSNSRITAGYRVETWLNANNTVNLSSINGNNFGDNSADLLFHGPYARFEYQF